jgi:ABC-type transport system substrate-binding protein
MKRTFVLILVLLIALAGAVFAGGKGEEEPAAEPEAAATAGPGRGGTLTFGVYRPIPNLAYYQAYDASNNLTAVAIWDTVLRFNEKGEVVPGLAESWEVEGEDTIVLHLREGVKFHDGTTMEAQDVVASLEFARNPDAKSPMAWMLDPIESLEAVDARTVQIKTGAVVDVLNALATPVAGVSSQEAIAEYGIGLGENPIGAGPFKLESWDRGSQVVLTRFEDYWEQGKPYLDKVVFKIILEEFTRLSSLRTGDLDIVYNLSFANVEQVEEMKGFDTNIFSTYIVYYLALNMKKEPFSDVRVRQALNYAIDRNAITKAVTRGYAIPAITDIAPEMAGSLKGVRQPYPYDPEKAEELLEQAGYPNGFSMKLLVGSNSPDAETGVVLQEYYKNIGINVELVSEESSTLWNHLQAGNYEDAAMSFWYPDFPDAAGTLVPFCYSTNTPPDGCCNFSYYANPEVDKLLDQAAAETDLQRRAELFQQVNEIIYEDAPRVWIYHIKEAMPSTLKVKGLNPGPMFFFQHFLQDVWLAE